jgi:hypothetical protein
MQPSPGGRRAPVALLVALTAIAFGILASSALANDLVQGAPTNVAGGWFDDHSISGDNHAGWRAGEEPLAVKFHSTVTNQGAGDITFATTGVAGAGFLTATQAETGAPIGFFRYVIANHFGHNRWQLLDFQRFALVRVGGPEAIWDTRWGTCVNNTIYSDCSTDPNATALAGMGFPSGLAKTTQDGADEDEIIAIPNELGYRLPEGAWQVVAIVNPYGRIAEASRANDVACTGVTLTWNATPGAASPLELTPRTMPASEDCQVPSTMPPAITGPADPTDPLRFAKAFPACANTGNGHCWTTPPTSCSAEHPTARTFISGALVPATDPCDPTATSGGNSQVTVPSRRATRLRMTRTLARRYAPQAVKKALRLRRTPRGVRSTCRVTSRVGARCTVRWSAGGVRGRVWLRFVAGRTANRWEYKVDLRRTRGGHTTRIRRDYRTGGTLRS